MTRSIPLAEIAPQPWRNGAGRTRELLSWPAGQDWALRISVADVEADGPFSDYPGVERWFAVIDGPGLTLEFPAAPRVMVAGDPPLRFDGSPGPGCRVHDGPTRDLNLMARRGHALMRQALPGVAWQESFAMRGLYAAAAGRWASGDGERRALPAHTLLWADAAGATAWAFEPDAPGSTAAGWWLGFTPWSAER